MAEITPEEFAQQTRDAVNRIGSLTEDGLATARQLLREAQKEIVLKLSQAPTDYGEWFFTQMQQEVERQMAAFQDQATRQLEATLERVADEMNRVGLGLGLPQVSRQTIEFLTGYNPGQLIGGLSQDGKASIIQELRLGLLGVKTPYEIQKSLGAQLGVAGPFGSISRRAEAIWATEANRAGNVLATERYKRIAEKFPGRLKKQWLHSGNTSNPRSHHQKLDGKTIDVDEKFEVAGYEVDGPHDPILPAEEVIRCGCTTILVEA